MAILNVNQWSLKIIKLETCQFDDLLFEITAKKQDLDVNMTVKIFRIAGNEKIEIANPNFNQIRNSSMLGT
jgi:hypothetical protein